MQAMLVWIHSWSQISTYCPWDSFEIKQSVSICAPVLLILFLYSLCIFQTLWENLLTSRQSVPLVVCTYPDTTSRIIRSRWNFVIRDAKILCIIMLPEIFSLYIDNVLKKILKKLICSTKDLCGWTGGKVSCLLCDTQNCREDTKWGCNNTEYRGITTAFHQLFMLYLMHPRMGFVFLAAKANVAYLHMYYYIVFVFKPSSSSRIQGNYHPKDH